MICPPPPCQCCICTAMCGLVLDCCPVEVLGTCSLPYGNFARSADIYDHVTCIHLLTLSWELSAGSCKLSHSWLRKTPQICLTAHYVLHLTKS